MRRLWFAIPLLIGALVFPSPASAEQAAKSGAAGKARATAASPVNLNSASVAQLQTLPGIGASANMAELDPKALAAELQTLAAELEELTRAVERSSPNSLEPGEYRVA